MTTFTEKVEEALADGCLELVEYDIDISGSKGGVVRVKQEAKQAIVKAHQAEISRVLERVEKEVIGDDEEDDLNPFGMVARPMAENGLRFKQRQAINKIKGELQ